MVYAFCDASTTRIVQSVSCAKTRQITAQAARYKCALARDAVRRCPADPVVPRAGNRTGGKPA